MNDEEPTMYLMSYEPDLDPYARSEWDNPVCAPTGKGHRQGCSYHQDGILAHCDCGVREVVEALGSDDPLTAILELFARRYGEEV